MPDSKQAMIDYVYGWKQIIDNDLNYRINNFDDQWRFGNMYVRDAEMGRRRGNLVAEFTDSLHSRLLTKEWDLRVEPLDPAQTEYASDFKRLADNLSKAVGLSNRIKTACSQGVWCGTSFVYLGHPLDPEGLFPDRRMDSPDSTKGMGEVTPDELTEVPVEEVEAYLGAMPNVPPLPDNLRERIRNPEPNTPLPVDFGLPWCVNLSPLQVILPKGITVMEDADYVAVLHFLTTEELNHMGFKVKEGAIDGTAKSIFERLVDRPYDMIRSIRCVVEVFVKRDRMNPAYSWYHFAYMSDDHEQILYARPNKHGKFIPISALKLEFQKNINDTTIAGRLAVYADLLDVVYQALYRRVQRELHLKYTETMNSGLDETNRANLLDPTYEGLVKVNDHTAVKMLETTLEDDLFKAVMFLRSTAQATSGQSDLDRGQAIKGISARQTDVLAQASGVNVLSISNQISAFIRDLLFRLIYLVTRYGAVGKLASYNVGRLAVVFSRGSQDITSSLLYQVHIRDIGSDPTVEQQLSFNQLLRTLEGSQVGAQLTQRLSMDWLASSLLSVYGYGSEGLAQVDPTAAMGGPMGLPGGQPGLSPGMQIPLDAPMGGGLQESVTGQHPERQTGSRGMSAANAMSGLARMGMGVGE